MAYWTHSDGTIDVMYSDGTIGTMYSYDDDYGRHSRVGVGDDRLHVAHELVESGRIPEAIENTNMLGKI